MEKLNNTTFCFNQKDKNNIDLFLGLAPSRATNDIDFACINILLNNQKNVLALLLLPSSDLERVIKVIPSQMKTLICLNNFNAHLAKSLECEPSLQSNYDLILNTDYKKYSGYLSSVTIVPALNNDDLKQLSFNF